MLFFLHTCGDLEPDPKTLPTLTLAQRRGGNSISRVFGLGVMPSLCGERAPGWQHDYVVSCLSGPLRSAVRFALLYVVRSFAWCQNAVSFCLAR